MTSTADPPPIPQLIDRLLVIAEANDISPVLTVNKIDLEDDNGLVARYRKVGYSVFPTSAEDGTGIAELKQQLIGSTSVVDVPAPSAEGVMRYKPPAWPLAINRPLSSTARQTHDPWSSGTE